MKEGSFLTWLPRVFCAFLIIGGVALSYYLSNREGNTPHTFPFPSLSSKPRVVRTQPLVPFDTATQVRLHYNADFVNIDDMGNVNEGTKRPIKMTSRDIRVIQQAFTWSTPPEIIDSCCIPRHAFTFHDARGAFLGAISVCYECSCAKSVGLTPPTGMDWIAWDEKALGKIITSHGISIAN